MRVGQSAARHVEVVVGPELSLGDETAHRAGDEGGDLPDAFGVDVEIGERLLAGLEPAAGPTSTVRRRSAGYSRSSSAGSRGSAARRFSIARESGAARPSYSVSMMPATRSRSGALGSAVEEHVGTTFGGAVQHRGPEAVDVAELVLAPRPRWRRCPWRSGWPRPTPGRRRPATSGRPRACSRGWPDRACWCAAPAGAPVDQPSRSVIRQISDAVS